MHSLTLSSAGTISDPETVCASGVASIELGFVHLSGQAAAKTGKQTVSVCESFQNDRVNRNLKMKN